jgi:lysophospholipase L1-like esterase
VTRFLALGDSYTIGESVIADDCWPGMLSKRLGLDETQIIARTGWTTDELRAAIDDAHPVGPFDLVTLLIGVNDQYRGRDAQSYRGEFAILLDRAIAFAGDDAARVIVVSIPDWSVTPFASDRDRNQIAAEIDRFNLVNREEAGRAGAQYADIVKVSRQAGHEPELTAADRLHPSAAMYRRWIDIILPAARVALGRERRA